jgi:GH43 family beta-xylosidase
MVLSSGIVYSQGLGYEYGMQVPGKRFQGRAMSCHLRSAWLIIWLIQFVLCACAYPAQTTSTKRDIPPDSYVNPLGDPPILLQDPYIFVHARKYYLFGTASPTEGFHCYESSDLVNWKFDGWAWRKSAMRAARGELHSPQVFLYQGMFCLVYSARMASGTRLALAAATQPEGPYHDLHVPWLALGEFCTSGDVFIDDNGKAYLTFTQTSSREGCAYGTIYGVSLNGDLSKIVGTPLKLLEPTQRWELVRRDSVRYNGVPRMFKINGKYYLTYSANDPVSPDRAIGYARADKPLGTWTKALDNPLLSSRAELAIVGPGQGSVFRALGGVERFVLYESFADPANPYGPRAINIDRLQLKENRQLSVAGPTRSPQPLPAAAK